MIKPVYFGHSKEDKFLLEYVSSIENFSDWVKSKLCEEFDVKLVGMDKKQIKITKEKNVEITIDKFEEEKVNIKDEEFKENEEIVNQWTL